VTGGTWRRFIGALLAVALLAWAGLGAARDATRMPEMAASELPREARATLALIERGGPFPYERDGIVFGNFERRLPSKERGYYREYTVPTPGLTHRGARRIVTGKGGERYYTDDHYQSLKRVRDP
jgi:ribonuclease T1